MQDENIMKQVLRLAKKGYGMVRSNPLVGCIITNYNGEILGSGWHQKYGENHAEIEAILDAQSNNNNIENAKMYINLEPCCHFGKTPPCIDAIIKEKIAKVIIGIKDPFQKVSGLGISALEKAGIEVKVNILKEECIDVNSKFIINNIYQRPEINIKIATTIDGKMSDHKGESKWITCNESRQYVHTNIRNKCDAMLTTAKTILKDNPFLSVRIGEQIIYKTIIVVDKNLETLNHKELNIFKNKNTKIIFLTNIKKDNYDRFVFIYCDLLKNGKLNIKNSWKHLLQLEIFSLSTECGAEFTSYLLENDLFDKIYHFTAPILSNSKSINAFNFNSNIEINQWQELLLRQTKQINCDILGIYCKKILDY